MLDKYDEALEWTDKALKIDPNNFNSLKCKGKYQYYS